MTIPTVKDFENGKRDLDALALILNSTEPSVQTRVGLVIKTLYQLVKDAEAKVQDGFNHSPTLLDNESLEISFLTVTEYKNFNFSLPAGKVVYLKDRNARFIVISGVTTANERNIIKSAIFAQSIDLIVGDEPVPSQFGFSSKDELQAFLDTGDAQYIANRYGRLSQINGRDDEQGVLDFANFAGQKDYGNEPIGFVFHHYTDGKVMQIDNVGKANTILTLKNAQNTTRRDDKPADFVGSASFLSLATYDDALGYSKTSFYIGKDTEFVWTGAEGTAIFWQNKAEDNVYAFRYQTTHKHQYLFTFLNGLADTVFTLNNDVGYTRFKIESHVLQVNGLAIEAKKGAVQLYSSKDVVVNCPIKSNAGNGDLVLGTRDAEKCVVTQTPFKPRSYNNVASLPAANKYQGAMIMYSYVPAYSNGVNWKYVRDDSIIV